MTEIPTIEPSQIRAGDTIEWRREDLTSDYPASEWTLKYYLLKTGKQITITAVADEEAFAITVTKAVSAAYTAGTYSWLAKVYQGTTPNIEEHTVGQGTVEILPDLTVLTTGYDIRSHAKKVLDALESLIEGKSTSDAAQYMIAGRSIIKLTPEELIKWRNYYRVEYRRELNKELMAAGKTTSSPIKVRFRSLS